MPDTTTTLTFDSVVRDYQHWVTLVGALLTLLGIWFSYLKVRHRLGQFRERANAEVAAANLSEATRAIEDLLAIHPDAKAELLAFRVMHMIRLVVELRVQLPLNRVGLADEFQAMVMTARLWEKQIMSHAHGKATTFNHKSFRSSMLDLKNFLFEVGKKTSILAREKHDTR